MLTQAAHRALQEMVDAEAADDLDAAEIVREGRTAYLGDRRISSATVNQLLRWCLIRDGSYSREVERYTLNEDGRKAAADPSYVPPELLGNAR